jgi:hypothetical protein
MIDRGSWRLEVCRLGDWVGRMRCADGMRDTKLSGAILVMFTGVGKEVIYRSWELLPVVAEIRYLPTSLRYSYLGLWIHLST